MDRLFGHSTYDLRGEGVDLSKLLILYGDNGSGKTTILNCVFHLLSPATNRGHRGALARVPFSRFSVTLGDNTMVTAKRADGNLVGSFEMTLVSDSFDSSISVEADAEFKVKGSAGLSKPFFKSLGSLGLGLHFLSDERKIITDLAPPQDEDTDPDDFSDYLLKQKAGSLHSRNYLEKAIQRAVESIRKQAIAGSGAGELNANTLYTNITRQIVSPYLRGPHKESLGLSDLVDDLNRQAARSASFARFGLSSELPADDLLAALQSPRAVEHSDLLHQILRPFVDGFKVRLDAQQTLHDKISTFVETINAFFQGKKISFRLGPGFVVTSDHGGIINPNVLSSGEKQLLLLLCNILAAGGEASIFIIDEPELSLNVKWQRKLVDALLDCTRDTRTQFVLATHSLELLTQHQHNVLKLEERTPV